MNIHFCVFDSKNNIISISIFIDIIFITSYRQNAISFNSTLQLINDISNDLQKLFK